MEGNGKRTGVSIVLYIDATDFDHEIECVEGTTYPNIDALKAGGCARTECGVYRVQMTVLEYLSPTQIKTLEGKNHGKEKR